MAFFNTLYFHWNGITVECYVAIQYVSHNCVFREKYALLAILSRRNFLRFSVHQRMAWCNPYSRVSRHNPFTHTRIYLRKTLIHKYTYSILFVRLIKICQFFSNVALLGQLHTHMDGGIYTRTGCTITLHTNEVRKLRSCWDLLQKLRRVAEKRYIWRCWDLTLIGIITNIILMHSSILVLQWLRRGFELVIGFIWYL
jgi:hypothetical protein